MAQATPFNLLSRVFPFLKALFALKDFTIVIFVVGIMAIIIVPLPSFVLDLLLTLSLSIATLIILISIFIAKPTDFSTYPTMILLVTLFRIVLNIATTRMILSEGHNGPEAVSDIIASFGSFVVGGNYVIGIVVFTILVLVNFMVVTNGSTRVAEVAARFSLDAMPGKQMAIDADLNAGLINEEDAKKRRQEIVTEANFYGAMDGASKFVKGDAIAGIIITIVNIVGGILIGVFQNDLSVSQSAATYTLLTIGDGLVGQIPALLVATATGIIITRASKEEASNFASGAISQLGRDYKTLLIVGFILFLFAIVPGLPTLSLGFIGLCFILMALLIRNSQDGAIGAWLRKNLPWLNELSSDGADATFSRPTHKKDQSAPAASKPKEKTSEERAKEEESAIERVLKGELLELDMGYQLIKLAGDKHGGDLSDRIRTMRRKIAGENGFLMPQVYICDNLQLEPNSYEIKLKGVAIGNGQVFPGQFLAINSGLAIEEIDGTATKEPAFGLDATWIHSDKKSDAIVKGYTVVDPATVIATHLTELVKKYAEDMLTREDVQKLIDILKKDYPTVVADAIKATESAGIGLIQAALKNLLHEKIPIKDMLTIMEAIADLAPAIKNSEILTELIRSRLKRTITSMYKNENGVMRILTLEYASEQRLLDKCKDQNGTRNLLLNVREINALVDAARTKKDELISKGVSPIILIVEPQLRRSLAQIFERFNLDIVCLSHSEIENSASFEVLGNISIPT
ncbi:MAG: flagellar biosynthesis protein FlhA [Helicobacteraceae bacterium]|jgi:flagellar biosynthesis protein FlhA|nr:flagellar biosynthesis protein FlhA [Helicobacteraceae bacterium]